MKTAVDSLRLKHQKAGPVTWITTSLDVKAILEFADRVEKLEVAADARSALLRYSVSDETPPIKPLRERSATESPAEQPFKINGPGRYRLRNGETDDLCAAMSGYLKSRRHGWLFRDGHNGRVSILREHENDPVAGPLTDSSAFEMGCLTGLLSISQGETQIEIDLSKVPASAFVKPDRKPKLEAGWVNVHQNRAFKPSGLQFGPLYPTKQEADQSPGATDRVACIEVTFKHGEGLTL